MKDESQKSKNKRMTARERKKQICDIARKIFLQKGFSDTTMEDIVKSGEISKGGLYHHYRSTVDILHDIMIEGNALRFDLVRKFADKNRDLSNLDLAIELTMEKIFDKNPYKSIYVMFLVEAEKNQKLKELERKIYMESKEEFERFIENKKELRDLKCLANAEFIMLMNSMIVSSELLNMGDKFLKINLFRDIIKDYIKKHKN